MYIFLGPLRALHKLYVRGIHKVRRSAAHMRGRARSAGYPTAFSYIKARLYSLEDKGLARVSDTDWIALSAECTMNFMRYNEKQKIFLPLQQKKKQTNKQLRTLVHAHS